MIFIKILILCVIGFAFGYIIGEILTKLNDLEDRIDKLNEEADKIMERRHLDDYEDWIL